MWDNLTRENYLKLHVKKDNFQKYKEIPSVLLLGKGSLDSKDLTFFIPAYKRAETLEEAVQSILSQKSLIDYEIIIVDNSGDIGEDNQIYQYVKNLNDTRISLYVNKENIGMFGNFNRGIELANTKYVAMLHDDDILADNYIEEIHKVLKFIRKDNQFGFLTVKSLDYHEEESLPELDGQYLKMILTRLSCNQSLFSGIGPTSCPTCGMIFSRNAFIDSGGFDELYYPSADYILGYQMMKFGYNGYVTNKPLAYYRIGINESTKKDINIGFVMADYYFSEYMYSESKVRKIFGELFRNVQYTMSVDGLYENALRFGVKIDKDELKFCDGYGVCLVGILLFRVLRKLYFLTNVKQIDIEGDNY